MPLIQYNPSRPNSNLRGIVYGQNSALDTIRKSLSGITNGLQNFDKQGEQRAKDAFSNRIAGLSQDELSNFNVEEAAQGNRLNAVTLRDMLKQRTNDQRAEEEALFKRQQIEQQRINNPKFQEFAAGLNQLRAQGTSKEGINAYTQNFLQNNSEGTDINFRNQILEQSLNTGNTVRQNNRAENEYQDSITRRAQQEAEKAKLSNAEKSARSLLSNLDLKSEDPEAALKAGLRNDPAFQALDLSSQDALFRGALGSLNLNTASTAKQRRDQAEIDTERDINIGQLDQSLNKLNTSVPTVKQPLSNPENIAFARDSIKKTIVNSGNTTFDTTARATTDAIAGTEILAFFDDVTKNGLVGKDGTKLAPGDIDAGDLANLIAAQHEVGNMIEDEGIPSERVLRNELFKISLEKKNNKELYREKSNKIQKLREKLTRGGLLTENEQKTIQEDLLKRVIDNR